MSNSKLREIRKALNLNQKDFAAKLGIQQSYYSALELGKKYVPGKILESLFMKIGVNPEWYFSSKGTILDSSIAGKKWGSDGVNTSKTDERAVAEGYQEKSNQRELVKSSLRNEEISKLIEKQEVTAEKVIQELILNNDKYALFRECFFEILSFRNIIDNITYSNSINKLFKIEDITTHYLARSANELKGFIDADFARFGPYIPIFQSLADAMKIFREKAKNMPTEITGIDKREFDY